MCNPITNPSLYRTWVSLDVDSLFTNVSLEETIDIIINWVYNNPRIPPPSNLSNTLKQLLKICYTAKPFKCNGSTHRQINGLSMGSPLDPTVADFFMSHLENQLLSENNRMSNPWFYRRYVDDIVAIFGKDSMSIGSKYDWVGNRYWISRTKKLQILNFTSWT